MIFYGSEEVEILIVLWVFGNEIIVGGIYLWVFLVHCQDILIKDIR
jgi:hypothetical protein